jgi:hypothetical protein
MAKNENAMILLIEGEPWLGMAKAWKESYVASQRAALEFCRSMGAKHGVQNHEDDGLGGVGIPESGIIPPGWRRIRRTRGAVDYMVPQHKPRGEAQKEAAAAAKAAFDAVPRPNSLREIAKALGLPGGVSWETPAGSMGSSGFSDLRFLMKPMNVLFMGETYAFFVPDTEPQIAKIRAEHPDATITGEWTIPPGLKRISDAQWDLLVAQWKVAREKAGDAAEEEED